MPDPRPTADPADHELARGLAVATGELLLGLRARLSAEGATAGALKAAGDRAAHELLLDRLAAERPGDAVLSEEGSGADGPAGTTRLGADRVWIIDPLDGTREFSEPPRDDWAVHVALVRDGVPVAGSVALPAQGIVLSAAPAEPLPPVGSGAPRLVVSRTRPPAVSLRLADELGGELVAMGSAGAKVAAVVRGHAEVYAHAGGQYEWDSCAPVAVALAAGLVATRLDGRPLVYNEPDPYLPDLLVCHPALADRVRAVLDRAATES